MAARACNRVESSVGSREFRSFIISGISVHPQDRDIATLILHADHHALKVFNSFLFEDSRNQLIHDYAVDLFALRLAGPKIREPFRFKRLRIDIALD
jgi:hypothetical protein